MNLKLCNTGIKSGMAKQIVHVSARLQQKFSASNEFALWLKRFNLYLEEAEVPREERAKALLSLLNDATFRVVGQLGLLETITMMLSSNL